MLTCILAICGDNLPEQMVLMAMDLYVYQLSFPKQLKSVQYCLFQIKTAFIQNLWTFERVQLFLICKVAKASVS